MLLLAAVIGLSWLTVNLYRDSEEKVLPGQNYYSATTPAETTEQTEGTEAQTEPQAAEPEKQERQLLGSLPLRGSFQI